MTLRIGTIVRRREEALFIYRPNKPQVVIVHPFDVLLKVPLDWTDSAQLYVVLGPFHPIFPVQIGKNFELLRDLRRAHSPGTSEGLLGREADVINRFIYIERNVPLDS